MTADLPADPPPDLPDPALVVLVGPSGSGKSTWAAARYRASEVVSSDALRGVRVLEEVGRNLTPSPFLTTAVVAVRALEGTRHAERWFPGILAGETVAALAVDEGRHHHPANTALRAERHGNGFVLDGEKSFVVHGASADVTIVAARTSGAKGNTQGITLFAVVRSDARSVPASASE